jgi:hypothetical protein
MQSKERICRPVFLMLKKFKNFCGSVSQNWKDIRLYSMSRTGEPERRECMNNRRIWFRLGGVLAAAAVCTGGAAVVSDRAQEAKNVQRAFLGAMETQMQIGCYPSETGSPADLTERERTELQTAYTSRVEQYYTEENPCRKRYIALNEDLLAACDSDVEYSESGGVADCRFDSVRLYADRMTAVVQAQTVVWDKRISGNPEQGFSVELPVNRDTITATMKKENGV